MQQTVQQSKKVNLVRVLRSVQSDRTEVI